MSKNNLWKLLADKEYKEENFIIWFLMLKKDLILNFLDYNENLKILSQRIICVKY